MLYTDYRKNIKLSWNNIYDGRKCKSESDAYNEAYNHDYELYLYDDIIYRAFTLFKWKGDLIW